MRADFNVVGTVVTMLLCVAVLGLIIYFMSSGVIGQMQETAQHEKGVLLCDNAVQAIVNSPGRRGGECLQKYCVLVEEDDEKKCEYTEKNDACNCEAVPTGVDGGEVCVVTNGYNTPGLLRKIDIYNVCGYDMTESNECENGRIVGERSDLWLRLGRLVHLACEHGAALNEVDDIPTFVEVCKLKLAVRDYKKEDSAGPKSECSLGKAAPAYYSGLVDPGKKVDLDCMEISEGRRERMESCIKYLNRADGHKFPYKYYLCMSQEGLGYDENYIKDDGLPCAFEFYGGVIEGGKEKGGDEYMLVYTHEAEYYDRPLVVIKHIPKKEGGWDSQGEAMFCG